MQICNRVWISWNSIMLVNKTTANISDFLITKTIVISFVCGLEQWIMDTNLVNNVTERQWKGTVIYKLNYIVYTMTFDN